MLEWRGRIYGANVACVDCYGSNLNRLSRKRCSLSVRCLFGALVDEIVIEVASRAESDAWGVSSSRPSSRPSGPVEQAT